MALDKNRNLPETIGIYCLYVLVGALPLVFIYQSFDIFELAKLTVLRLTTLVMIGAWAVMCYRERRFIIARTPIDWFIVAYLAVYTLATVFSQNFMTSLLGEYGRFEGLLTIYNYAAVFFLAGIFIRKNSLVPDQGEFVRSLLLMGVGTAALVSIYGVFQRFGLDFLVWSSAGTDTTRAFSTMGNPIYIAAYLTIMISVAIVLFVEGVQRVRGAQGAQRGQGVLVLLGAAIALMFVTLVLTFSRAGWGGMIVSLVIMGIIGSIGIIRNRRGRDNQGRMPHRANSSTVAMTERSKQWKSQAPVYIALIVVVVVVTVGGVTLSASKASGPTKSALSRVVSVFDFTGPAYADRVSLWKSSIEMIKDRPVLGYGPDMFGTFYTKYRRLDIVTFEREVNKLPRPRYQNRPHMDILQQGVSAGVLGMLAYIAMWGAFLWFAIGRLLPRFAPRNDGTTRYMPEHLIQIGLIAGVVGYLFQIQFSFSTVAVTPLVWLAAAMVFSGGAQGAQGVQRKQGKKSQPTPLASRVVPKVGLVVTLVILMTLAIFSIRPIIADYYFDQGVTAYENRDSFVAQDNFEAAMSFSPYESEYAGYASSAFVEMAKQTTDANTALGLLIKSIDFGNRAIALNPHSPGYRFNLGNAEYYYSTIPDMDASEAKNTMLDAEKNFVFAVQNDQYMTDYRLNLASAYLRFEKKAEAIKEIKAALKIDPTRLDAKAWLATLEKGAGQ